ncbi:adenosylcobinamide-phosphate synthase CbiB [Phreatobacter sp.]|uniref:adenosylcobinamide-phosphate synthase CbiB n=1 Tax=Phreatobacter sp. TaxID=1966341 RepID=UPI003F70837F
MLPPADLALILLFALALDAAIGDPDAVWRRLPHPVAWMGAGIAAFDRWMNHDGDPAARRRLAGVGALALLMLGWGLAALALQAALLALPFGWLWLAAAASVLIAQNSLVRHVARVCDGLAASLAEGRRAVSMIVGRDPESLDEAGVARAAIESAAENYSDGVVAPAFWFLIGGLPGLVLYKLVNTADSMIGHRTARHEAFGWAAARLDDLMNLLPARLSAVFVALAAPLAGGSPLVALRTALADARLHRSPNAGWPEAAAAGALGLALAGPRRYGAHLVEDPFLNAGGRRDAGPADIARAIRLIAAACLVQALAIAGVWLLLA